jgi:hypothetical protein
MTPVLLAVERPPSRLGDHLLLTAACVVVLILVIVVAVVTTRRRVRRNAVPDLPQPPRPMPVPVIEPMPGVALGTTSPGGWREGGVSGVLGSRQSGELRVTCVGIDLPGLWLPAAALRDVRIADRFATKFMPGTGLLVFAWEADGRVYESGFRGQASRYEEVVAAVRALTEQVRTA